MKRNVKAAALPYTTLCECGHMQAAHHSYHEGGHMVAVGHCMARVRKPGTGSGAGEPCACACFKKAKVQRERSSGAVAQASQ